MKIYVASDHAGFELKNKLIDFLRKSNCTVINLGPYKYNKNDDYVDYAKKLCKKLLKDKNAKGILICGTGQGMCIAANKFRGIYAAPCWNKLTARLAAEHLNANVLCLGAWTVSFRKAKKFVKIWLSSKFSAEEKRKRRLRKIKMLERK